MDLSQAQKEKCMDELGLDKTKSYTEEELKVESKRAFRNKAKEHHPDKGGDPEKFKRAMHAHLLLTDESYRHSDKRSSPEQRNLHAVFNVVVDFEQAFFGDTLTLTFNPLYVDDSGKTSKEPDRDGKNVVIVAEIISLRVRPGTMPGDNVVIPKMGLCCKKERGDMKIALQVIPSPKGFRLSPDGDVHTQHQLPLHTMLAGGEVTVSTMWGERALRVPAGTLPETVLQIKGCGVNRVGNHNVQVSPSFPTKEELKQNPTWGKLNINWKQEEKLDEQRDREQEELEELFKNLGGFKGDFFTSGTTFTHH
jgi:DnaJ-class molecular chaperone